MEDGRDIVTDLSTNSGTAEDNIKIRQNTQKGKKEIQDKVLKYLGIYSKMMGIEGWNILVCFKKLGVDITATCEAEIEYYRATITFDSLKLEEQSDNTIRKTVIHELLHCLVWQLAEVAQHLAPDEHKEFIQKFEESTVTNLERMPIWEFAAGKSDV